MCGKVWTQALASRSLPCPVLPNSNPPCLPLTSSLHSLDMSVLSMCSSRHLQGSAKQLKRVVNSELHARCCKKGGGGRCYYPCAAQRLKAAEYLWTGADSGTQESFGGTYDT